ncbi:MAG TPA: FAD-binding oxidoreductase [Thermoanaerobaculia bacterium]|nr:FAD-binding oxidoreductase [Thermoanaerobaculia bacterium]
MTTRVSYLSLVKLAKKNCFTVTCPWDASYQKDMTIWNRRLQTGPAMVAFCKKKEDVQICVGWCRDNNDFPLRVRSGRHHHEGMSCDYGVLIIDLSLMNTIRYTDRDHGWIPPGKQLQSVYKELEARGQIIPGGGCETVCVGGLTLGGGWGMSARALGLTCDNILEAEIVLADGSVRTVNASDPTGLFWALQGGGAGNFGIVTNFLFKLTNVANKTSLSQTWTGPKARLAMVDFMEAIANNSIPRSMTLACRLFLDDTGQISFMLTIQSLDTRAQTEEVLRKLTGNHPPASSAVAEQTYTGGSQAVHGDAGLHDFADSKMMSASSARPGDTCLTGPLPHKVSSAFVKNDQVVQAAEACYDFLLKNNKPFPNANTYISFHSFGGAIADKAPKETAFFYRDRMLLLQFQAWWSDPADDSTDQYINWIWDVRTTLASRGLTDGGFFNFQDASIAPEADRHALMKYYYGGNLDRLIGVKIQYDPKNIFQSGMSIPTKR